MKYSMRQKVWLLTKKKKKNHAAVRALPCFQVPVCLTEDVFSPKMNVVCGFV